MSEPVAVELTDGLDDSINATVSIPRSVLQHLLAADSWVGHDLEIAISGQEQPAGKVTINIFEG